MKTEEKPSDLINQAITNSIDLDCENDQINELSGILKDKLWEAMKLASRIEILKNLKNDNS